MIEFEKAGNFEAKELRPEEFVYLAIKEEGFSVGNTKYYLEHIPREGYTFSTEFSDGSIDTQVYYHLSDLIANIELFFKVLTYE